MAANMAAGGKSVFVLFVSLFAILFYLALIYNVMWNAGAQNVIRIENGRMEKDRVFALKAALFASAPNLFLALLMTLGFLLGPVGGLSFGKALYGTMHLIAGLFEAVYVGLFTKVLEIFAYDYFVQDLVATLLYILSSLPMILVAMGAYALGMRNVYLFGVRKPKKD
jgi:hypothetical protein